MLTRTGYGPPTVRFGTVTLSCVGVAALKSAAGSPPIVTTGVPMVKLRPVMRTVPPVTCLKGASEFAAANTGRSSSASSLERRVSIPVTLRPMCRRSVRSAWTMLTGTLGALILRLSVASG